MGKGTRGACRKVPLALENRPAKPCEGEVSLQDEQGEPGTVRVTANRSPYKPNRP